jgi:cytochrome b subunit of formate dehydrogenase
VHFLICVRRNLLDESELSERKSGHAILRFTAPHRRIHLLAVACVLGLAFTGLPLKFSRQPWIGSLMALFGGPDTVVFLHRLFAVVLIGTAVFHGISVWIRSRKQGQPLRKRILGPDSLLPRLGDFRQFFSVLRWAAGRGSRPALDRWSYREKFDYWALAATAGILACSGLFIWFPTLFARFFSGYWFNVAMVVHSDAGLLAIGFAVVIHILNSSLRRAGFPVNDVMFTGQLSEKEFREERSAQYERLAGEGALDQLTVPSVSGRNRKIAFYGTLASQVLGILLFILILLATIV